jgi:hypothetical protein
VSYQILKRVLLVPSNTSREFSANIEEDFYRRETTKYTRTKI